MTSAKSHLSKQTVPAGSFIFVEGDEERHFYIIESGEIEIFTMVEGKLITLAKLGPGDSFGEFALLADAPRSASARAVSECSFVKVSPEGFEELLLQLPEWASCMLRSFAQRLRSMSDALKKSPQFLKSLD